MEEHIKTIAQKLHTHRKNRDPHPLLVVTEDWKRAELIALGKPKSKIWKYYGIPNPNSDAYERAQIRLIGKKSIKTVPIETINLLPPEN